MTRVGEQTRDIQCSIYFYARKTSQIHSLRRHITRQLKSICNNSIEQTMGGLCLRKELLYIQLFPHDVCRPNICYILFYRRKGEFPLSRFCPRTLTYVKIINVRKNEILRAQLRSLTLRCPISNAAIFLGFYVRYTHVYARSAREGFRKSWTEFNFFAAVCSYAAI